MSRKDIIKTITVVLIIIFYILNVLFIRYLILYYDPLCSKDWECDPDWKAPEYYRNEEVRNKLEECARYGADNLLFSQYCNGRYKYIYDAEKDEYKEEDYNIVRHAGTTYALLDLYNEIGEEEYLRAGVAGLDYLVSFNCMLSFDEWAINYNYDMNVGTVSLTILAMVRYYEATEDERYNIFIEKYANFIVSQQREDGAYSGRIGSFAEERYYSAEAFFALSLSYDLFKKQSYLNSIEKALNFYWDKDYDYNNSAFIPWASSGAAKWYELTGDNDFRNFCFEMSDLQITRQYLTHTYDKLGNDLYGYMSSPTVNTGVYLEGIGDALRIAKKEKDNPRIESYKLCLKAGIEWITSLQFRDASQLACPNRGFGGFHRGFIVDEAYEIRIDYIQHAISAFIRAFREFNQTELKNIEIRDGNVDFKPKRGEESLIDLGPILLVFLLIIIPSILGIFLIAKKFRDKELKKDSKDSY
ncbi:MAG: hypothetical protein ACTSR8_12895 [Promethearchaeota archaeon]